MLLLEKAYAKMYGTYDRIEAGLTGDAIRDLTGLIKIIQFFNYIFKELHMINILHFFKYIL